MNAETVDPGLLAQAEQLGGATANPAPGAAPAAPIAPPADPQAEARGLLTFAIEAVAPLYPSLRAIYTEDTIARIAAPLGRLMAKYNLTMGSVFERWEPEISTALVVVPLVGPTLAAIKADRAAAVEKAKAEAAGKST